MALRAAAAAATTMTATAATHTQRIVETEDVERILAQLLLDF